eukprot:GHVU01085797.1.p1 GENE.GHVU01085797.1~~GHVU01085797.1.p1  ORF type:complete len:315 (+),score=33.15 GHVU01085797.1:331-1275(+)
MEGNHDSLPEKEVDDGNLASLASGRQSDRAESVEEATEREPEDDTAHKQKPEDANSEAALAKAEAPAASSLPAPRKLVLLKREAASGGRDAFDSNGTSGTDGGNGANGTNAASTAGADAPLQSKSIEEKLEMYEKAKAKIFGSTSSTGVNSSTGQNEAADTALGGPVAPSSLGASSSPGAYRDPSPQNYLPGRGRHGPFYGELHDQSAAYNLVPSPHPLSPSRNRGGSHYGYGGSRPPPGGYRMSGGSADGLRPTNPPSSAATASSSTTAGPPFFLPSWHHHGTAMGMQQAGGRCVHACVRACSSTASSQVTSR